MLSFLLPITLATLISFLEGQLSADKATKAREALRCRDGWAYKMTSVVNSVKIKREVKIQYLIRNRWRKKKETDGGKHLVSSFITTLATTKLVLSILPVLQGCPSALLVIDKHLRVTEVSTYHRLAPLGAGGRLSCVKASASHLRWTVRPKDLPG